MGSRRRVRGAQAGGGKMGRQSGEGPAGRERWVGRRGGLDPDRSGLFTVLVGEVACWQILIFPFVFDGVLASSLGLPGVFRL